MPTYEIIEEKRDMIKVRYKGIETTGYRYKEGGTDNANTRSVPDDKSGAAAWAAQHKHSETTDKGLVQQRDDDGNFTDEYVYDPAQDEEEPDEDQSGETRRRRTPAIDVIESTDFVERVFDPTPKIDTTTEVIERQQRYSGIPYDDYAEVTELVIDRLTDQTQDLIEQESRSMGIMWSVRYAVIGDSARIVNYDHEELEYAVMIDDIRVTRDMDSRKTKQQIPQRDGIQLMLGEIETEESLPNQFRDVISEIFRVIMEGSGDELLVFQSVVEGWRYD